MTLIGQSRAKERQKEEAMLDSFFCPSHHCSGFLGHWTR